MKISKRINEFRISVEDDDGNYINTNTIIDDKPILCRVNLKIKGEEELNFPITLPIDSIKALNSLLTEVVKHLEI
jgi:hypothetical protein